MLAMIVKYLRWEMRRRKGENKGGACRGVQRGRCEKIICKVLAMIVKYLWWEMSRRTGENKGDACSGVQRGLSEEIDL